MKDSLAAQGPPLPRPALRRSVLQLWLVNIAFGVFLGVGYLGHVPESDDWQVWLFALPALVSSVVMLTLAPGLIFTLWASVSRSPRLFGVVQSVAWTVFQVLLYTDTRIYRIFRYHFNGQVVNLLFAQGSEDALYLGWTVWAAILGGLFGVSLLEYLVWKRLLVRALHQRAPRWRAMLTRPALVWSVVLIPAVCLEKSIYAHADHTKNSEVIALSKLFPLYHVPRISVGDGKHPVLGSEVPTSSPLDIGRLKLEYPRAHPTLPADGPRPNVLIVGIDCWRHDMLTARETPRLWELGRESLRFENHVSGGNSTRFGLFALLYGLHGPYWFPVLAERRSPVLVDALLETGYDLRVFSSASMNYPELRSTAWVRLPERVADDFAAPFAWRRDELAAEACVEWLRERGEADEPFFGFLMLDSPHQKYSFPPGATPFLPSAEDIDYMELSDPDGVPAEVVEAAFNRYRNAVHHSDTVAGSVLDALDELGLAEDTLLIVTGDHGEEFFENGLFGHTSTFAPVQVRVPFLLRGPGVEPGIEARPTAHVDVPATLLEALGADPELRPQWTLGGNLLEPAEERRRILSGWNELGMWTQSGILRLPLTRDAFDVELYSYEWELILDRDRTNEVLESEAGPLAELAGECNRFLQ